VEEVKSALASKAVWGGIIAVAAGLLGLWGYKVAPEDQARIVELAMAIGASVGGVLAIYGRVRATKRIG
jgi:hypothetical protein